MGDIPLSLPVEQVGALALAIPAVALVVVQLLKAMFYRLAPCPWQEWLPDRPVWMGLAFLFCVVASLILRLDIPNHLFGSDWPASLPWWVGAAVSGVLLGVAQAKVLYPLAVKPQVRRESAAAVTAACGPSLDDTQDGAPHWTEGDPGGVTRSASPPEMGREAEAVAPASPPVEIVAPAEEQRTEYSAKLLTGWPVHDPTHPRFILLRAPDGRHRVIELT